jgi:hypothetical protein
MDHQAQRVADRHFVYQRLNVLVISVYKKHH